MKYVVKLGGATIEDKALLHACGKAISELVRDGNQVAVVHGGGKQLTATLAQMGKKSDKHSCQGQNSCKGKGGCKTGDNGCKGKNSCKGKGGCATDGSKPAPSPKP